MALPDSDQLRELCQALLQLRDERECRMFLEDLCTIKEISALAQRLEIARRLERGDSYLATVQATGASSATVSRVNRCLEYGAGGYRLMLGRLPALPEDAQ